MTKVEHQELINKLAKIGYDADGGDKNAVFLAIAASYSLPYEKLDILKHHAEEVANNQTLLNIQLILETI
jgi:hypothetical protein